MRTTEIVVGKIPPSYKHITDGRTQQLISSTNLYN